MKRKIGFLIAILILLLVIRQVYLHHAGDIKDLLIWLQANLGSKALLIGGIAYMFLLSIPFFPGVELGWLMILFFGKTGVILIYLFTLCGLTLSFIIGRCFEKSWLTSWLDVKSLRSLFNERSTLVTKRWNILIPQQSSNLHFQDYFLRYRYIILAILINTPGNAIIGGGGGIAFICGMNRSFSWQGFILTITLATAPLPILLYLGFIQIETLIR